MLTIRELLELKGLDCKKKIKLVRHRDRRYDVEKIYREGQIEIYQSFQAKPVFKCDYIVSFIGFEGSYARMIGVYQVKGIKDAKNVILPKEFIYPEMFDADDDYYYELQEVKGFEDFNGRVVIDWGKGALSWVQWLKDKEVVEILPKGYVKTFTGYLDFILSYDELVTICENPVANREWHNMLSAVAGIYLIVEHKSGMQYVGSTYGQNGILGRWKQYAKNGHGGNIKLQSLLSKQSVSKHDLTFTVLRTLPKTLTKNEVINYEVLYKNKLGSKVFGLNLN